MQPQENPCRVLLGFHGDSTEGLEPMLFRVYDDLKLKKNICLHGLISKHF